MFLQSVDPGTGEIIFDEFEDSARRDQLETRLTHIKPAEILLPETISAATTKLVSQLVVQRQAIYLSDTTRHVSFRCERLAATFNPS